ncbi:50S ribosomal protein L22 [candidate division Kazan bacterium]|uniref:Large ribosomal subunit protein uL22 n=1 Tax=candidate division Kazan bacterium TaxID=2202143 RepID=A0A420ZE11_UNCK3|nr:MAG: 50S ribosomal protein L22 [candidate division Kazan bacterium]
MEVKASSKFVRISPKKVRPLLAPLKNLDVNTALHQLLYHRSKASRIVYKLIKSAVSNAQNNYNLKENNLKIKSLTVDSGPSYKRYWFRSRGSADRLLKRNSHLNIVLAEIKPTVIKKTVSPPTGASKPKLPATGQPAASKEAVQDKPASDIGKSGQPATSGELSQKAAAKSKMSGFKNIFSRRTTNK